MKHYAITLITALVALFTLGASAMGSTVYVKSLRTYMFDSPSLRAQKLISLERGMEVNQLAEKGRWVQIEYQNNQGWLPKMMVSDNPIKPRVSLLSQKVDIASAARRRASRYSSTAAVRSLTSGRKRIATMQMPDYEALRNIERIEIDEAEAIEFLLK